MNIAIRLVGDCIYQDNVWDSLLGDIIVSGVELLEAEKSA